TFASVPSMAAHLWPWLYSSPFIWQRFDSLAKIPRCHKPVFIAHGTDDRLVPISQSEKLHERANEPKELFRMPGLDHNHTPVPAFYPRLRDFLARSGEGASPADGVKGASPADGVKGASPADGVKGASPAGRGP